MTKISKNFVFAASCVLLLLTVLGATYLNYRQDKDIDRTKLPLKVEESKGFQKWITNLKNKGFTIEADEFKLLEENEIYNTKWMSVYNLEDPGVREQIDATLLANQDIKKVVFSPSDRQFIDYRSTQIRYYGLRDAKLLDARLLDCDSKLNCYFDRAYFLDNDVFVISEFSLDSTACPVDQSCTYSIKIHLVDLNKNSRLVYKSKPFDLNLAQRMVDL